MDKFHCKGNENITSRKNNLTYDSKDLWMIFANMDPKGF